MLGMLGLYLSPTTVPQPAIKAVEFTSGYEFGGKQDICISLDNVTSFSSIKRAISFFRLFGSYDSCFKNCWFQIDK